MPNWCRSISLLKIKQSQYPEAEKYARQALVLDGNSYEAWALLGTSLGFSGKKDEAEESFAKALAIKPDDVDVLLYRGIVRNFAADYSGAAAHFAPVLESHPQSQVGTPAPGIHPLFRRGPHRRHRHIARALQRDPQNAEAARILAASPSADR